ncbi:MAG: HAD family phosphatase [Clostridia bacterium]|nr:HAD family phosphatase [Clostridia bacterium]
MTYLFDFDGTLVDSMPIYIDTMLQILEDFDIDYPEDIVKIITPLGTQGTADYYIELGVPLTREEIIERMGRGMVEAYFTRIPAKEGVIETLRVLKDRGDRLNVLTASPHITLDACLKRLGIFDWFDHVWSCDDFATTKADPEIYKQAAGKMGVPVEDVLFLDDNLNAIRTAQAAGMQVCGVYDASSEAYEMEMRAVSGRYVKNFRELFA